MPSYFVPAPTIIPSIPKREKENEEEEEEAMISYVLEYVISTIWDQVVLFNQRGKSSYAPSEYR